MVRPAKNVTVIEHETETLKLPRKPLGFIPFKLKKDFWNERYVGEVWRGKSYAEISCKDAYKVIEIMIEAWKRFGNDQQKAA